MIIEQIYVLDYKFSFLIKIKLNKLYRKTIIFINTKNQFENVKNKAYNKQNTKIRKFDHFQ